jgi:serine-type D-Ala-D-Ala carboxypeptidase (penicillin-binding protein 5/6)
MLTNLFSLYFAYTIQSSLNSSEIEAPTKIFNFTEASIIPIKNSTYISPIIEAKSSIAMDLHSGEILHEKNIHDRLKIASITKLMTALIILEENNLDETVHVSQNAASINGSTMYLRGNEDIKIKDLMKGVMINSANDAATALAEHNAGSVEEFIKKMNKKTLQLGLVNTHFSNPMGLDDPENYSSAYDVAKLANYVYQKKFIKNVAQIQKGEVYSLDGNFKHELKSTNDLLDLDFLNIKGLKTGRTEGAGLCLVTVSENKTGNEIVTVVLNSPARFKESKILIDWIFRAYNWTN